jgi:hypothetical protein
MDVFLLRSEAFSFKLFGIFVNNSNKNPPLLKAGGTLYVITSNSFKIRNIIIFTLLLFISCEKKTEKLEKLEIRIKTENPVGTLNFHKIDYSLKVNYFDSLAKKNNPNRKYQY